MRKLTLFNVYVSDQEDALRFCVAQLGFKVAAVEVPVEINPRNPLG